MPTINFKGLKVYVSNGKTYAYHRASGKRIKAALGTPQFFLEFARLDQEFKAPRPNPTGLVTWGQLAHDYQASPKFRSGLAERTKRDYHKVFDYLDPLAEMELSQWTRGFTVQLRDKAHLKHGWRFANHVLTAVSAAFTWAVKSELFPEDKHPVRKVDPVPRPKNAGESNRPWEDEEWRVVTSRAPKHLLAPILLCGLLGWREGEALSRPKTDYDRTNKTIKRIASKSGILVETPAPEPIVKALEAIMPHDGITLLVNSRGRPWTENGFRASVFKFLRKLEAEGAVGEGLTIHGLRHTVATRMREIGWDLDTIKDMLGQKTAGMAGHYSRRADLRKKLKAVVSGMSEEK